MWSNITLDSGISEPGTADERRARRSRGAGERRRLADQDLLLRRGDQRDGQGGKGEQVFH
ncbi:hypothetical protein [Variovorax sp. W2I14]|uniref:hypothetical protein n=1 Tax=Variovorax sp. W2I14 TaxID=3042290 RepID=UPI003D24BC66